MPHIDHAALWVTDLDGARDFYSHWFNGHSNGLYENPRTGLRTYILHFTDDPREERRTRLELMSRPDVAAPARGRRRPAGPRGAGRPGLDRYGAGPGTPPGEPGPPAPAIGRHRRPTASSLGRNPPADRLYPGVDEHTSRQTQRRSRTAAG